MSQSLFEMKWPANLYALIVMWCPLWTLVRKNTTFEKFWARTLHYNICNVIPALRLSLHLYYHVVFSLSLPSRAPAVSFFHHFAVIRSFQMSLKLLCCIFELKIYLFLLCCLSAVCTWTLCVCKVGTPGKSERPRIDSGFVWLARTGWKSRPEIECGFRVQIRGYEVISAMWLSGPSPCNRQRKTLNEKRKLHS